MSGAYNTNRPRLPLQAGRPPEWMRFFLRLQDVRRLFIHVYYFLGMNNVA